MLPINYPSDRDAFGEAYLTHFSGLFENSLEDVLAQIKLKDGSDLTWKALLICPFDDLYSLHNELDKLSPADKLLLDPLSTYSDLQPTIASFFMEQTDVILDTCYYCNIDTIFTFSEIGDYKDGLDFIQRADLQQLQLISQIGPKKAQNIIESRAKNQFTTIDDFPVSAAIKDRIVNFKRTITHNHFTLDHFLHKSEFPFLSLCLYNLVPSCYACNSKFKGMGSLYVSNPELSSPSAAAYRFHRDVSFRIYYHKPQATVSNLEDFSVELHVADNQESHAQYLNLLKIRGRYFHFKKYALWLMEQRKQYPDSKLNELSSETGMPLDELKKVIFGEELFDSASDQKSLIKYRRDIATSLNI